MSSSPATDYLADYARLGVAPDCTPTTLEQAWRRVISASHPDRASESFPQAADDLHEATAAYRRLRAFERRYGRLPGHANPIPAPHSFAATASTMREKRHRPAYLAVGLSAALIALLVALPWTTSEIPSAEPSVPDTPENLLTSGTTRATATLKQGDSADQVHRLLGPPILQSHEVWEYGPSHVRFARGHVVDWYSSPLRPLPVASERAPVRHP
ncbi:MAG: J domain-containing protein [Rhodanobacteraceae bacterium]|nr:J domain-containing protein [Rhodanobacteraceae bacterium]